MINYSIVMRRKNVADKESEKLAYATAQYNSVCLICVFFLSFSDFSRRFSVSLAILVDTSFGSLLEVFTLLCLFLIISLSSSTKRLYDTT